MADSSTLHAVFKKSLVTLDGIIRTSSNILHEFIDV
jgi:hypothetical protein